MRYLSVEMTPGDDGGFHPVGAKLREEPAITREAIHHIELLADETVLVFAEGSGDSDRYEAIMSESSLVDEYLVSGVDRWMAVNQFEPSTETRRLLELERGSHVVIETPVPINADGSVRVTFVGSDSAFQDVFHRVDEELSLSFEIVETGSYDPDTDSLRRVLTTRQQEVLEAAVDVGFYNAPREATQRDVAERIGIAPTTAGEHLRKIEERVFDALTR
ncbi:MULTISPECIES: helix-turn-helix domain-containing protein [Halolamina]|uniref:HTH DNA binding domain-containing protein n=1 Tax=Halolamina pelagica TaxID=699431 RepID=A0A1I5NVS7_9EURY|nr:MULTISPECIES: helix-turn-helix domain-containing protein [Halolamina]NHX36504.1 helix-turn-helix domain-containing protein [Halolamina sp. R1-12]SFP25919.1 HTH DNA binding domain-containing protein [Halolamina pelagica]